MKYGAESPVFFYKKSRSESCGAFYFSHSV